MKNFPLLFLCLVSLLFVSCEEDNLFDTNKVETWKSERATEITVLEGITDSSDSLMVVGFKQNGRIELKVKFNGVGKYTLTESGTAIYHELVGDEISNTYNLDPNDKTSELVITKWDLNSKAVEATFQVTLKKSHNASDPNAKETLQFTGGEIKGTATVKAPTQDPTARQTEIWKSEKAYDLVLREKMIHYNGVDIDSLSVRGYKQNGTISISIKFKGVGKYPLKGGMEIGSAGYYDLDTNGEIINAYYSDYSSGESELVITEWDPETKLLKGTFQITFKKSGYSVPSAPETIRFTGGIIDGKVTVK